VDSLSVGGRLRVREVIRRPVPDDHPWHLLVQHPEVVDRVSLVSLEAVVGLQDVDGCLVATGLLDEFQPEGGIPTGESEHRLDRRSSAGSSMCRSAMSVTSHVWESALITRKSPSSTASMVRTSASSTAPSEFPGAAVSIVPISHHQGARPGVCSRAPERCRFAAAAPV